jgi:hypothetical protein
MGTNCLLIESGRDLVLVDTGQSDKQDARFQEIYAFERGARRLPECCARRIRARRRHPWSFSPPLDHCG